jgi:hypothetical protein
MLPKANTGGHRIIMLPKAGNHMRLWIKRYCVKLLKPSLSMLGFSERACAAAEKGRWSELCLMVLKRCTKRREGKELLERQRASSAWVHVRSRSHRATNHGDLSILVRNVRGWEEGGNVEVRFSLWRAWLTCTCALDLHTLDTARKEEFAAKEELVVVAALVSACKIQHKKRRSIREMLESQTIKVKDDASEYIAPSVSLPGFGSYTLDLPDVIRLNP